MKKTLKYISSLMLALGLAFAPAMVHAEDTTITFLGEEEGFDMGTGSEYTATDLFNNFKNVMPGDSLTQVITIENKATDSDYIDLYMKAEVHDEDGDPILEDEDSVTMTDFLSQLNMKLYQITSDGTELLIYDNTADDTAPLTDTTYLFSLRSQRSAQLRCEVEVPIELGNEYMNREGVIDWTFQAEGRDIELPETPDRPETPTTPDKEVPDTGDHTNLYLYGGLGLGALALVGIILVIRKKNA